MKPVGTIKQVEDGTIFYFKGRTDKLHRLDGPAVIWADGTQMYYVDGKRHRTDGPAVIWANGTQEYYVDGKRLTPEEFALRSAPSAGKTVEIDGQKYKLMPV